MRLLPSRAVHPFPLISCVPPRQRRCMKLASDRKNGFTSPLAPPRRRELLSPCESASPPELEASPAYMLAPKAAPGKAGHPAGTVPGHGPRGSVVECGRKFRCRADGWEPVTRASGAEAAHPVAGPKIHGSPTTKTTGGGTDRVAWWPPRAGPSRSSPPHATTPRVVRFLRVAARARSKRSGGPSNCCMKRRCQPPRQFPLPSRS